MPYKYIGRTHDFKGKSLWEIVGNLKNFGVGRVVRRQMFERYPEPSYLRILNVTPRVCPETQDMDNLRKVEVLVQRTFRGRTLPEPITIHRATYKTDYILVPKDEEENFCKTMDPRNVRIFPKTIDFPPLMKEWLVRDQKLKNGESNGTPKLEVAYNPSMEQKGFKVAEEGEQPTETLVYGMAQSSATTLYKDVKPI